MPTPPVWEDAESYLSGSGGSWTTADIMSAFNAESSDQANKCKIPASRSVAVTTTDTDTTITGIFLAGDVDSYVIATGVPSDATILSVALDGLSAVLSAAATATGSVTATVAVPWDWALREALFRRVAHNLALRPLLLGLQVSMSDAAVSTRNVGGSDAEANRLEGPYRKRKVG